ncbi:hypothetical protein R4P47_01575 [Rhodococcus sp. IEGM 1370]|uniref:hypothetical protein n=1 Tax=Rhodococcus sp. IEGM 1370 TaxID=3082222 RepID=UPI0029554543|nr:hypothetical protein [Rhodococcus sp. IEGM 1370]MDV8075231.1 hypothetical protein [Rhodococcus sp. IEGM 1370]
MSGNPLRLCSKKTESTFTPRKSEVLLIEIWQSRAVFSLSISAKGSGITVILCTVNGMKGSADIRSSIVHGDAAKSLVDGLADAEVTDRWRIRSRCHREFRKDRVETVLPHSADHSARGISVMSGSIIAGQSRREMTIHRSKECFGALVGQDEVRFDIAAVHRVA